MVPKSWKDKKVLKVDHGKRVKPKAEEEKEEGSEDVMPKVPVLDAEEEMGG